MTVNVPSRGTGVSTQPGQTRPYSGVDNLEAMEAAVRYRTFLAGLVRRAAGPPRPDLRVLDFGAGVGTYARMARESGYTVSCVELDPELGSRLSADGFTWAPTVDRFAPGSFDLVYTFNVLEHIEADAEAVESLQFVTKPGGKLLVYVPAFPLLFSALDRHVGHVRRYRRSPLVHLIEAAGFTVDACRFADSLGFAASLAYRAIGGPGVLDPASVRTTESGARACCCAVFRSDPLLASSQGRDRSYPFPCSRAGILMGLVKASLMPGE